MNYYESNQSYFERAAELLKDDMPSTSGAADRSRKPISAQITEMDGDDTFDSNLEFLRSHFKSQRHVVPEPKFAEPVIPRDPPPGAAKDTEFPEFEDAKPDPYAYVDDSQSEGEADDAEGGDGEAVSKTTAMDAAPTTAEDSGAGVGLPDSTATATATAAAAAVQPPVSVGEDERRTEMNREIRREGRQRHRRVGEMEDQFYDATRDDKDEKFMREMRQRHLPQSLWNAKPTPILSCPCCFTLVCLESQRHEQYINQYRTMFVMNVVVSPTEVLRYSNTNPTAPPVREFYSALHTKISDEDTIYRPVHCASCATELGVVDADEVYHLYHVMAEDP